MSGTGIDGRENKDPQGNVPFPGGDSILHGFDKNTMQFHSPEEKGQLQNFANVSLLCLHKTLY